MQFSLIQKFDVLVKLFLLVYGLLKNDKCELRCAKLFYAFDFMKNLGNYFKG